MGLYPERTIRHIINEFFKILSDYSVEEYRKDDNLSFYIVNDSLVLVLKLVELKREPSRITTIRERMYNGLEIEELTYNEIGFKYNHSEFVRRLEKLLETDYLGLSFTYTRFRGYTRLYWCLEQESTVEYYNRIMPELRLRGRYESWEGIKYNFIVIEMEGFDSSTERLVLTTTAKSSSVILDYCLRIVNRRATKKEIAYWREGSFGFWRNFYSWENENNQSRIENHMKYFVIEEYHSEKEEAWNRSRQIEEIIMNGGYGDVERGTYLKPLNRWKSEELVYNIIKGYYKKYKVIYQHRPFFLRSSIGGQMSYDIFIPKFNIAIEYQGRQHFEPIDFFGGETGYQQTRMRDLEKKKISAENGVKLTYINYWEDITNRLVIERVSELMANPQNISFSEC